MPLLPGRLGYYDLRDDDIREQQAALATEYRIDAFVYYHYWFHGRRLLELPLERLLASARPRLPFCLCWANESWSRRWDGGNQDVLIAQTYSPEDDERHLATLVRVWEDDRYLRIDGRPVTLVWRATDHPDIRSLTDRWRDGARRAGHPDLFLIRVESHGQSGDPTELGFDAACEFQPSPDVMMGPPAARPPRTVRQRLRYDPYLPERLRTPRWRRRRPRDRVTQLRRRARHVVESGAGRLRALPLCRSIVGQLRPATTWRAHPPRQHASSLRALGTRGGHASPRAGATTPLRQRVERVGGSSGARTDRAMGRGLPRRPPARSRGS